MLQWCCRQVLQVLECAAWPRLPAGKRSNNLKSGPCAVLHRCTTWQGSGSRPSAPRQPTRWCSPSTCSSTMGQCMCLTGKTRAYKSEPPHLRWAEQAAGGYAPARALAAVSSACRPTAVAASQCCPLPPPLSRYDPSTGKWLGTLAGSDIYFSGADGTLNYPNSMAVDASGALFVANSENQRVEVRHDNRQRQPAASTARCRAARCAARSPRRARCPAPSRPPIARPTVPCLPPFLQVLAAKDGSYKMKIGEQGDQDGQVRGAHQPAGVGCGLGGGAWAGQ